VCWEAHLLLFTADISHVWLISYFGALCDVGKELCSFADATCLAVAISAWRCCCCMLVCQVPLDSFLVLSFWWGLIVKLLLHGVLIDCLVALDAVELGWLFFQSLGGSYLHRAISVPICCLFSGLRESYCRHAIPVLICCCCCSHACES